MGGGAYVHMCTHVNKGSVALYGHRTTSYFVWLIFVIFSQ